MIPIAKKPANAQEYTVSLIEFDAYSIPEQIEYWRSNHKSVKFMHDRFPDAYQGLVDSYGKDVMDSILAIA